MSLETIITSDFDAEDFRMQIFHKLGVTNTDDVADKIFMDELEKLIVSINRNIGENHTDFFKCTKNENNDLQIEFNEDSLDNYLNEDLEEKFEDFDGDYSEINEIEFKDKKIEVIKKCEEIIIQTSIDHINEIGNDSNELWLGVKEVAISVEEVAIYTDGSAKPNPGPGGYAVVLKTNNNDRKELSCGFRLTTNNRMELLAAIEGLRALKSPCKVNLYSDSKYVVDPFKQRWLEKWQANGWKAANKKSVMNIDLWKMIIPLTTVHEVKFIWVKGHSNNIENARCDQLAEIAAEKGNLAIDEEYEKIYDYQDYLTHLNN